MCVRLLFSTSYTLLFYTFLEYEGLMKFFVQDCIQEMYSSWAHYNWQRYYISWGICGVVSETQDCGPNFIHPRLYVNSVVIKGINPSCFTLPAIDNKTRAIYGNIMFYYLCHTWCIWQTQKSPVMSEYLYPELLDIEQP